MLLRISHVDRNKDCIFSEYTEKLDRPVKGLFRLLSREFGRCTSRVYVDKASGEIASFGWVFESREEYTDARDSWAKERKTYIRETWVSLEMEPEPVVRRAVSIDDAIRQGY